ncbi:hypothetical protein, partial [Pseudoalteromonas sp. S3431]|uniref:hypothetical protein n=1 Tax=Pseudoalteromonas sp. S3431 TaxID=579537 RepID=UPI000517F2F4
SMRIETNERINNERINNELTMTPILNFKELTMTPILNFALFKIKDYVLISAKISRVSYGNRKKASSKFG